MTDNTISEFQRARTDALDATADAVHKIRKHYDISHDYGYDCLNQIEDAASSAEDAMFYLASAASDDDDSKLSDILAFYGLESIRGDSASEM